ncbi:hypothetical protein EV356DRAFT_537887 [Viridothelium virens]|uniref:Uncharacterized protein n=1 Tax=Viridothelium virens TaxID=1048519 RepID=A0A6A6GSY1_VIRVR|nr:hypothetical protein EV356DRAFT_537887 [Viridothelium virens]
MKPRSLIPSPSDRRSGVAIKPRSPIFSRLAPIDNTGEVPFEGSITAKIPLRPALRVMPESPPLPKTRHGTALTANIGEVPFEGYITAKTPLRQARRVMPRNPSLPKSRLASADNTGEVPGRVSITVKTPSSKFLRPLHRVTAKDPPLSAQRWDTFATNFGRT